MPSEFKTHVRGTPTAGPPCAPTGPAWLPRPPWQPAPGDPLTAPAAAARWCRPITKGPITARATGLAAKPRGDTRP